MPKQETCPICKVVIEDDAKVLFSYGPPGTRARLWARVCNYAKNPGCINQCEEKIGDVASSDYYN